MTSTYEVVLYNGIEVILNEYGDPVMPQSKVAQILGMSQQRVSKILNDAIRDSDLTDEDTTTLLYTATDGKNYYVKHYNLDAILLVGFRARRTQEARAFRRWVTDIVREHLYNRVAALERENELLAVDLHHARLDLNDALLDELTKLYPEEE